MILERARNGDTDFVWHAVELFIDFVNIFVRVVQILLVRALLAFCFSFFVLLICFPLFLYSVGIDSREEEGRREEQSQIIAFLFIRSF
jgi:hypothetical protein